MCKNHNQLHYNPMHREAALILAGQDPQVRDALLAAAVDVGLQTMAAMPDFSLSPTEQVRVMSRLEAARAGLGPEKALLRKFVADRHSGHGCDFDDPPF